MGGKIKGLILTLIFSFIILLIFFGKILRDPGNYYFSPQGDGFKAYYGALYHSKYDTSLFRMDGMNYPFGEVAFFTGCQPVMIDLADAFCSVFGVDTPVVAIINLLMIFSILAAAIFLYLIFYGLRMPWWYSALVATGISILSPQLARMGGHFSLAYVVWLPLMIYLIMKYDRKGSAWLTGVIAFVTFFAGLTSPYYLGFYAFMLFFYWLYRVIYSKRTGIRPSAALIHFLIQFVLPVIAVRLFMAFPDHVTDRTAFPFGFTEYRGNPVAVFLPNGRPYTFVRQMVHAFNHIDWEALSFVGMAALGGFVAGIVLMIKKLVTRKAFYRITDVPVMNVLFWASVAALLFSFGIPFILGLENLADYIGPLRQFRAVARFSWLFYYMLNIVVFYSIFNYANRKAGFNVPKCLMALALFFLIFDGIWNISIDSRPLHNRRPELEDKQNTTQKNNWVKLINPDEFQAILPLPYFHVGSENIWVESQGNTQELAMYVSLKTGLPMTAVQLSRTSISQTFLNYQLVTEPLSRFKVLDYFRNEKPLLLLINKRHIPSEDEGRLIKNGEFIYANDRFELRKLALNKLRELPEQYRKLVVDRYKGSALIEKSGLWLTDTTSFFIYRSFDDHPSKVTFKGEGALTCLPLQWNTIIEDTLKNVAAGKKFTVSFWIYDYLKDGNLRINLEFYQKNIARDSTTNYIYTDVHRHIRAFENNWALIEFPFTTRTANEGIKLSLRSRVLKKDAFKIDELLIRESDLDIYSINDDKLYFNSRAFKIDPDYDNPLSNP